MLGQEGRKPLPDHAGELTLLSRSGGEKGLRGSGAGTLGVPLGGPRRVGGLLGVAGRLSGTVSPFRAEQGTSLETPSWARASSCQEVGTTWFFSSCGGILELRRGSQPFPWVGPGKPNLPLGLRGKAEGCARVTAGPKRPHLGVCPGPSAPLQGRQGSRGCIPCSPGESDLASRGSKGSALLPSRDADILVPPEWPQGSPASSSLLREDS